VPPFEAHLQEASFPTKTLLVRDHGVVQNSPDKGCVAFEAHPPGALFATTILLTGGRGVAQDSPNMGCVTV
jgi:hypothetical protein